MKIKTVIPEMVMTIFSLVILLGSFTFFAACPVSDEGNIMSCHYAQVMVTALGGLLTVLSLTALLVPDQKVKGGVCIAAAFAAVLTALTPSVLIPLCKMPQMHCRLALQPFTILFAALTAAISIIAAILHLKRKKKS
ncbi:MAG: DUF4418 family protein [Ruminococcus sp.]|nr:DUF4418 family protein [Ruminococcus sp.]